MRAGACTVHGDGNFSFDLAESEIKIGLPSSEGPVEQLWCWSRSHDKARGPRCNCFSG